MYTKKKIYENFYALINATELNKILDTFLSKNTEFKSKSELNVYINSLVDSNTFMGRLLDEKPISEYEMNTLAVVLNTTRENLEKYFEFYKVLPTITNNKEEELYAIKDSDSGVNDTTINASASAEDYIPTPNVTVISDKVDDTNTGTDKNTVKDKKYLYRVKVPKNTLSEYLYWMGKRMADKNINKSLFIKLSMDYFKSERA